MAGKTIYRGAIARYPRTAGFTSAFDPLEDLILHLRFLTATDYVTWLLSSTHGVPASDAKGRARRIIPHATTAIDFLRQSQSSVPEVAFVSGYYALLNLMKVEILFSPVHPALAENRLHGASYDPNVPRRRRFPSDVITIWPKGAIPLYYQMLTGQRLAKKQVVFLRDIYPFITDISAEWQEARGNTDRILLIEFDLYENADGLLGIYKIKGSRTLRRLRIADVPALRNVFPVPNQKGTYIATTPLPKGTPAFEVFAASIDRRFLYFPLHDETTTARMTASLLMPEEIPIVLAFFHLSSVARYNPEYLEHIRSTRYWPSAMALCKHGIYKFLLLFWSFLRQGHVELVR